MDDAICYMFSFLKFNIRYQLVCKNWNILYRKAIGIYPIEINVTSNMNNAELRKLIRYYNMIYRLELNKCNNIDDFSILNNDGK